MEADGVSEIQLRHLYSGSGLSAVAADIPQPNGSNKTPRDNASIQAAENEGMPTDAEEVDRIPASPRSAPIIGSSIRAERREEATCPTKTAARKIVGHGRPTQKARSPGDRCTASPGPRTLGRFASLAGRPPLREIMVAGAIALVAICGLVFLLHRAERLGRGCPAVRQVHVPRFRRVCTSSFRSASTSLHSCR